jgi:hypothetical protein
MYILKLLPPRGRQDPRALDRPVLARHPAAAGRQGAVRRPALRRDGGVGARGLRRRVHAAGDAHDQVRRHRRAREGLRGDRQGREHRRAVDPRVVQGAAEGDAVAGARRQRRLRGGRRRDARRGRRPAARRRGARHRPLGRARDRRGRRGGDETEDRGAAETRRRARATDGRDDDDRDERRGRRSGDTEARPSEDDEDASRHGPPDARLRGAKRKEADTDRHQQLRRHRDRPRVLEADPLLVEPARSPSRRPSTTARSSPRRTASSASASSVRPRTGSATAASTSASATRASSASAAASRSRAPRCAASAWATSTWPRPSPHLVLQGRPEPHRLPARHGSQGAREGPLLRRLDRHVGRRRGARADLESSRRRSTRSSTPTRPRRRSASSSCASRSSAARSTCADRQADRLLRRGPPVGRGARRQRQEARRRRAREAAQGHAQGLRGRHLRHRGLHRGRAERMRQVWDLFQRDEAEAGRQRRDALPRAQGPLRLAVRLRRVLPRRHGRRGDPRPARAGRPRRRARGALEETGQDGQGPEAAARGQAPEGRLAFINSGNKPE